MKSEMSLSAYVVGFVESALNNNTIQPPPAPTMLDELPASLASSITVSATETIMMISDNLVERNVDVVTGGDF